MTALVLDLRMDASSPLQSHQRCPNGPEHKGRIAPESAAIPVEAVCDAFQHVDLASSADCASYLDRQDGQHLGQTCGRQFGRYARRRKG